MDDPDRLVGRDAVLAALADVRRPAVVLIAGEPGIGKTAVLAAAARRAGAAGARVLWGQCWDGDGAPAYWPWIQIARATGADTAQPLARLLAPVDDPGTVPVPARFELFDAVVGHLSTLARDTPVVVVLDDLHWADEASLALLEFVGRHLHDVPILLLGAYRDAEAPDRLRRLAGLADTVSLTGLDGDAVAVVMAQVAGTPPDGDLAARVRDRTGGNPLFVKELTRLLVARGALADPGRPLPVVLDSVGETLRRRLARLSEACARMLSVAAVAGPDVRVDVLRRVSPDPADLDARLAEALAARILAPADNTGDGYRFSHDLFRETLYAWLTPAERTRWHTAVGRALRALVEAGADVPAAQVAAHFVAAAPDGGPEIVADAVAWSRRAATDALSRLAPDDARHHYERAVRTLDAAGTAAGSDRLALLLGLADAHNRAGDEPAARATYHQAARLARATADASALADAALGVHHLGAPSGLSHAEPIALLRDAERALPADSPRLPLVLAALARDHYHSWEHDNLARATRLADRAADLARRLGDRETLAHCLLAWHDTRWLPGSAGVRLPVIAEILDIATDTGDRELHARAMLLRATARLEQGDPQGILDLSGYCDAAQRSGHARGRWQAMSRRATAALIAGDVAAARTLSDEAAELGERIGEPDWSSVADSQLWEVLRLSGERKDYPRLARNAATVAAWPPWRALELADDGDTDRAAGLLADFDVDHGFRPGARTSPEPWVTAIVAEAVAAAGTAGQRDEMYRRLAPLAGGHVIVGGCAAYGGAFDHYLGLLAASRGDAATARAHLTDAIAAYGHLGARAYADLARRDLDRARGSGPGDDPTRPRLRPESGTWSVTYAGRTVHLPDQKGLHDLTALISRPGQPVHVHQLLTGQPPSAATGADPILDPQAKAAYRKRSAWLDEEIDEAERHHDLGRAERARSERDALRHELAGAVGLGGRDRRLGDSIERARKTVTSRIRDTITRIRPHHPDLADHLDAAVTTGIWCSYTAPEVADDGPFRRPAS